MSENIVLVNQDEVAEDRFKRWLEHFRECIERTDILEKQELVASANSVIASLQSQIVQETQTLPTWCTEKAFQKPPKSGSGDSGKVAKNFSFAKNVSTVDDLKLDCRQLSTPHVISEFMAFKDLVNEHLQHMTQGSMDATNSAANLASATQVDVLTNTTGNMAAVENVLMSYVACINGDSNDSVADMCKLMDTQHRLNRSNARDESMLSKLVKQERMRTKKSLLLLDSREAQLQLFGRGDHGSCGSGDDTAMVVAGGDKVMSCDERVVYQVMAGIAGQYDEQMRVLAEAHVEEERARKIYEAAVLKRNASAAVALKTEQIYSSLQSQVNHVSKVASARVELEKYNHSSASGRLTILDSMQRLILHLSRGYVRTQIGNKAYGIYHSLFMWWRSLCVTDTPGSAHQATVNLRIGMELVRLCKQLLPSGIAKETGLSDELVKFETDLGAQLAEQATNLDAGNVNSSSSDSTGSSFVPTLKNSTAVLYFDHLVHGTPDDHVEAAARTETSMQALRAQALQQLESGEQLPLGSKSITFCCCNDVIAPPIWTLLLVHCPSYLKQLWALNTEAKLNDWLCPLEFDTEWESPAESSDYSNAAGDSMDESDVDDRTGRNMSRNRAGAREFTSASSISAMRKGAGGSAVATEMIKAVLTKTIDKQKGDGCVSIGQPPEAAPSAESLLHGFNAALQVFPQDECFSAVKLPSAPRVGSSVSQMKLPEYVVTPYGVGTVIPGTAFTVVDTSSSATGDEQASDDLERMVTVQLSWGRGTFRSSCVQPLHTNTNTKLVAVVASGSSNGSTISGGNTGALGASSTGAAVTVDDRVKRSSRLAADGSSERRRRTYSEGTAAAPRSASRSSSKSRNRPASSSSSRSKKAVALHYNHKLIRLMLRLVEKLGSQGRLAERLGFKREYLNVWLRRRATQNCTEQVEAAATKYLEEHPEDRFDSEGENRGESEDGDSGGEGGDGETGDEGDVNSNEDTTGGNVEGSAVAVKSEPGNAQTQSLKPKAPRKQRSPRPSSSTATATPPASVRPVEYNEPLIEIYKQFCMRERAQSRVASLLGIQRSAINMWINRGHRATWSFVNNIQVRALKYLEAHPEINVHNIQVSTTVSGSTDTSVVVKRPREELPSAEHQQDDEQENSSSSGDSGPVSKVPKIEPNVDCDSVSSTAVSDSKFDVATTLSAAAGVVEAAMEAMSAVKGRSPVLSPAQAVDMSAAASESEAKPSGVESMSLDAEAEGEGDAESPAFVAAESGTTETTESDAKPSATVESDDSVVTNEDETRVPLVARHVVDVITETVCGICSKSSSAGTNTRRAAATGLQCARCLEFFHIACLNTQAANHNPPLPGPMAEVRNGKVFWVCSSCTALGMKNAVLVQTPIPGSRNGSCSELEVVGLTIYFYTTNITSDDDDNDDNDSSDDESTSSESGSSEGGEDEDEAEEEEEEEEFSGSGSAAELDPKPHRPPGVWTKATVVKVVKAGLLEVRTVRTDAGRNSAAADSGSDSGNDNSGEGRDLVLVNICNADIYIDVASDANVGTSGSTDRDQKQLPLGGTTQHSSRVSTRAPADRKGVDDNPTTDSDIDSRKDNGNRYSRYESLAQPRQHQSSPAAAGSVGSDTYVGSQSLAAALCAAGSACRAVDLVLAPQTANSTHSGDCDSDCGSNAFVCTRPPGHHAGRYGCTAGCITSGFCLFNNAAIALVYARVKYGLRRVAVVDIDVHFGNGTSDVLKGDPNAFFASVHMVYGNGNNSTYYPCCGQTKEPRVHQNKESTSNVMDVETNGSAGATAASSSAAVKLQRELSTTLASCPDARSHQDSNGFYPAGLGVTEISDNYMCVGVFPSKWRPDRSSQNSSSANTGLPAGVPPFNSNSATVAPPGDFCQPAFLAGSVGFRHALAHVILPRLKAFEPELLIISAGFDGYKSDPLGGHYGLTTADFTWATTTLCDAMDGIATTLHAKNTQPVAPGVPPVPATRKHGKVVSLLEGGYDCVPETLGLARCVNAHVKALRGKAPSAGAGGR